MSQPIDTASVEIVPDFSNFPTELRRGVDGALRNLLSAVDRAFEGVERAAAEAGAGIGREISQGGEVAERALAEVSRASRREFGEVEQAASVAGAGLATRLGGVVTLVGTGLAAIGVAAGVGLGALAGFGLKATASLEQTQIAFNALLGSAELGAQVFKDLQQFAAATPFEFTELTGVSQRFFAFNEVLGLTDAQVTEFLTTLGDLASVTGSGAFGMERAAFAMAQVASRGALMTEEVNQLSDAFPGFNVRLALANELGMTTAEVMKAMERGEIDAATGLQALLRGMREFPGAAGAMEMQSKTLLGVFSTFKDTFSQALVAGFEPIIPDIKAALADVTPVVEEAIGEIAPALGQGLAGVLPLIGQVISAVTPILVPFVTTLGLIGSRLADSGALIRFGDALSEIADALAPLTPALSEVIIQFVEALIPAMESLAPQMPEIAQGLADLLIALTPILPALGTLVASLVELGKIFPGFLAMIDRATVVDWAAAGAEVADFFGGFWDWLVRIDSAVRGFFDSLPSRIGAALLDMHAAFRARIDELLAFVRSVPARIVTAIGNLGRLLVSKGRDVVRGLWEGISSMAGWLWSRVKDFAYQNTVGAFNRALGISSPSTVMAQEVGRWIPPGIGMGVERAMPELRSLLAAAGSSLSPSMSAGAPGGGAGGGLSFGPGSVVIQFAGVVPTDGEARRVGTQVAAGINDGMIRRDVRTAARAR